VLVTSPSYFQLLGANAAFGRVYGPADATPGFSDAVVISDGLWRRAFGASRDVVGRKVVMDTDTYTVVGVMPRDFRSSRRDGARRRRHVGRMRLRRGALHQSAAAPAELHSGVMGRLKPGLSLVQAQIVSTRSPLNCARRIQQLSGECAVGRCASRACRAS